MQQSLVLQKMLFPFSQERLVLVSANIVICTVLFLALSFHFHPYGIMLDEVLKSICDTGVHEE